MATSAAKHKAVSLAVLIAVLSSWIAGSVPAHADEKDQARKLLQAGDKYIERGDRNRQKGKEAKAVKYYERALDNYEKAYEKVPSVNIFFAIAKAQVKLKRYLEAVESYQKVIAETDSEELRGQAQAAIGETKQFLGTVILQVQPEGAEINIDGQLRGVAPLDKPMYFLPGEHTITVTAEGLTPYEETVTLEPGSEVSREIKLEGVPVIVKKPKIEPLKPEEVEVRRKAKPKRVAKPSKTALFLGGGLTLGLAGGATATGLMAMSKHSTYQDQTATVEERESARSSGKTLALVTDVLIAGAVVAAGYTAYHYFAVYRPKAKAYEEQERRRKDPNYWLSPYVDKDGGAGLAFGGQF